MGPLWAEHNDKQWIPLTKSPLTHWGRVTHTCVSKPAIIGSDDGLSPDRRQAIIWTNAGILLLRSLGTNFSEILAEIITYSFKKMYLKVSSAKWRPFCLGLNVLMRRTFPWLMTSAIPTTIIGGLQGVIRDTTQQNTDVAFRVNYQSSILQSWVNNSMWFS